VAQPTRRRNATLATLATLAALAALAAAGCIVPEGGSRLCSLPNERTVCLCCLSPRVPARRCGCRRRRRAAAGARLRARIFGDRGAHTLAHGRVACAARDEVAATEERDARDLVRVRVRVRVRQMCWVRVRANLRPVEQLQLVRDEDHGAPLRDQPLHARPQPPPHLVGLRGQRVRGQEERAIGRWLDP